VLDLRLQLLKALGLQPPNEAKRCDFATVSPFNLEGHLESSVNAKHILQGQRLAEPRCIHYI
jgi:hypothetical protein